MTDAAAAPAAPTSGGGGAKGKVENPTTVLILGFVTCGIYCIYWMWVRAKEMNDYLGRQVINPLFVVPGCLCGPLLIYVDYLYCWALPEMQKKAGIEAKDEKVMQLILMILLAPVGQYMVQQKLNEIWQK